MKHCQKNALRDALSHIDLLLALATLPSSWMPSGNLIGQYSICIRAYVGYLIRDHPQIRT